MDFKGLIMRWIGFLLKWCSSFRKKKYFYISWGVNACAAPSNHVFPCTWSKCSGFLLVRTTGFSSFHWLEEFANCTPACLINNQSYAAYDTGRSKSTFIIVIIYTPHEISHFHNRRMNISWRHTFRMNHKLKTCLGLSILRPRSVHFFTNFWKNYLATLSL
jgi:hypothetical protein